MLSPHSVGIQAHWLNGRPILFSQQTPYASLRNIVELWKVTQYAWLCCSMTLHHVDSCLCRLCCVSCVIISSPPLLLAACTTSSQSDNISSRCSWTVRSYGWDLARVDSCWVRLSWSLHFHFIHMITLGSKWTGLTVSKKSFFSYFCWAGVCASCVICLVLSTLTHTSLLIPGGPCLLAVKHLSPLLALNIQWSLSMVEARIQYMRIWLPRPY